MRTKYFLVGLFIFFCGRSLSQSLYEINYYFEIDKKKENYKAFIYRNDDGTGFIRVRMEEPLAIVEMKMEEHYHGSESETDDIETDSTILEIEGYEPKILFGSGEYSPDIFLFQLDDSGYYNPLMVISRDDFGKNEVQGVIENVRLLSDEDLTEDFVLGYFTKRDQFYINRFQTTVRALTTQEQATKLHLIVVANTEDASVGESTKVDRKSVVQLFKQVTQKLNIGFTSKEIFGDDYSKKNVIDAINNLHPGSNDIIVFYYSGHGFNARGKLSNYPSMVLTQGTHESITDDNTMSMEEAYSMIKAKNARLKLVFSDCCNTDAAVAPMITPNVATTRPSGVGWTETNCRALFLAPRKSILLTAASRGEYSGGNPATGGIFTSNFRDQMEKYMGPSSFMFGQTTWEDVINATKQTSSTKAAEITCALPGGVYEKCKQHAVITIQ